MMGRQPPPQETLFYSGFSLDNRVRKDHPLRDVARTVDFDFIYGEVKGLYGHNGNISIPPPVILKLMFLLVAYNVRSERELMDTLPERLDWLWFLGYGLDSEIPDHSVLSKARRKWGVKVFKRFFERIVLQCVQRGLVDGKKIFMDSSLVDADASRNSVVDTQSLKRYLDKGYPELEKRLAEREIGTGPVNRRYVSSTDPDAAIVRRGGAASLRYKAHRSVDAAHEVITATETTAGDVDDAHRMKSLMDTHQDNTGKKAETVVADSKYGTVDNFLLCADRGVKAHMPDLKKTQEEGDMRRGKYSEARFSYDKGADVYTCPAGKTLKRKSIHHQRQSADYAAAKKDCAECGFQQQCTDNKSGRTVKRHLRQEELDQLRAIAGSRPAKRDRKTRQHLMERSFARSVRYGFKRARWRGLWRAAIQEYMTAAIQNIATLVRQGAQPRVALAQEALGEAWAPPNNISGYIELKLLGGETLKKRETPMNCQLESPFGQQPGKT